MISKEEVDKVRSAQQKQLRVLENIVNALKDKERNDEENWIFSKASRELTELKWYLW